MSDAVARLGKLGLVGILNRCTAILDSERGGAFVRSVADRLGGRRADITAEELAYLFILHYELELTLYGNRKRTKRGLALVKRNLRTERQARRTHMIVTIEAAFERMRRARALPGKRVSASEIARAVARKIGIRFETVRHHLKPQIIAGYKKRARPRR
jgi:hypothetical protein